MVRRTEEGAWKWAFRDFLREEWRAIHISISIDCYLAGAEPHTGVYLRHGSSILDVIAGRRSRYLEESLDMAECVPRFSYLARNGSKPLWDLLSVRSDFERDRTRASTVEELQIRLLFTRFFLEEAR